MSDNWTGPLQDPPFWLNPDREITSEMEPPKLSKPAFVVRCVDALLRAGCNIEQAVSVTANSVGETGWGQKYRGFNLGGVKANKQNTRDNDFWWRALGHKQSGDGHTCFYKGFISIDAFFEYWLARFVPKTGKSRYAKTGQQFWAGEPWFDDLIVAGYKGEVTRQNPENSIEAHEKISETVGKMWAQSRLGVTVDGEWGPLSRAAAEAYKHKYGVSGSRELLWHLAHGTMAPKKAPEQAPEKTPEKAPASPVAAKETAPAVAPVATPVVTAKVTPKVTTEAPKGQGHKSRG